MVLDASVVLAWCFEDERDGYADLVLDGLAADWTAVAPAIWTFEVGNALVVGERRNRITQPESNRFMARLANYPITVQPMSGLLPLVNIVKVARRAELSVYDAAYLELAAREELPLATLDARLRAAAHKLRVSTEVRR
ncbi:MAG: type II toxin-antitoxin system VapC family toxin [Candidatus Binataceae bacterium]